MKMLGLRSGKCTRRGSPQNAQCTHQYMSNFEGSLNKVLWQVKLSQAEAFLERVLDGDSSESVGLFTANGDIGVLLDCVGKDQREVV